MDFGILFKRAGKVAADNSPAILTALGVSGTVATAYLAAKAAFQSVEVLKEASTEKHLKDSDGNFRDDKSPRTMTEEELAERELTTQEKVEAVWELYVPAAISGALTITAIICSNRISDRRTAALASAYSIVEKGYHEHRAKVIEKTSKKREQDIRDEISQDHVTNHPLGQTTLIITDGGETLCFDMWSGRYFTSSKVRIDKAVNEFNAQVINNTYSSLSEFWDMIGLPPTSHSDDIGWSTDKLLEISTAGILDENDNPGLAIDFLSKPSSRYTSAY